MTHWLREAEAAANEWLRLVADFALIFVADHFHLRVGLGLARWFAFFDATLTVEGWRWRQELAVTHGWRGIRGFTAAWRALTWEYADLVETARIADAVTGWDWPAPLDHVAGEEVLAMLDRGAPVVVVGCHFPYRATWPILNLSKGPDGAVVRVAHGGPWWAAWKYRDYLRTERVMTPAAARAAAVFPLQWDPAKDLSSVREMIRLLRNPGSLILIMADAPSRSWDGLIRPYAGTRSRNFPLGPARIARAGRASLVSVVAVRDHRGGGRLEWGPITPPDALADTAAQLAAMNTHIDFLERGIGRHREQFPWPVGFERRWNPALDRWEDRPQPTSDANST